MLAKCFAHGQCAETRVLPVRAETRVLRLLARLSLIVSMTWNGRFRRGTSFTVAVRIVLSRPAQFGFGRLDRRHDSLSARLLRLACRRSSSAARSLENGDVLKVMARN